jgi:nitrite reductase/ring-hydroxylating ferredoxin subunit
VKWLKRIFGICETPLLNEPGAWNLNGRELEIDLKRVQPLDRPGGAVRLEGAGVTERILIVRVEDGGYRAFRNRCTHMGRRIDPVDGGRRLECCSVSKSGFDAEGRLLTGPAGGNLKRLETRVQEGTLIVILP